MNKTLNKTTAVLLLTAIGGVAICVGQVLIEQKANVFPSIKKLMTQEEFTSAGLNKLDEKELRLLDAWLQKYTIEVAILTAAKTKALASETLGGKTNEKFGVADRISKAAFLPSDQNPKYNSSINPKYNSSINPKYNSSINPKYNSTLNPEYNSSINPKYSSAINPKYSSDLNPKYNPEINPQKNASLDPKTTSWSGYHVFDLDAELLGVAVRANAKTLLYFDARTQWVGYFIVNGEGGYNWFELDGEWVGYLVPNSEKGYNIFDLETEWKGFLN